MLSKRIALKAVLLSGSIVVSGLPPVNPGIAHSGQSSAAQAEGSIVADGTPMPIPKPPDPQLAGRWPPDLRGGIAFWGVFYPG